MELKKSPKADLEKKRGLFLEICIVLALVGVLLAFEWTKEEVSGHSLGELMDLTGNEEIIPITRRELEEKKEVPKPMMPVLEINLVDDDVVLDEEFQLDDFEANQDDGFDVIAMEEEPEEEPEFFVIVQDMPKFQGGGLDKFRNWVQSSIEYPKIAMENGISGTVYANFIVNQNGELVKLIIVRSVESSLDNEVIRTMSSSPKWEPGRQRGKPVNVRMTIPIKFVLQ
ncbi:MAG: energy transducer TonB [Bacteroidetes bacterium]|nr:energy transducer TonB [Bacteroidota bacterium]MBT3749308.1 energy transducer TonB [Bacteroidota bacterium]MBT4401184.1 energy transducer TonB [Bacteroidota bacterium]MBT4412405.1 energy transducer TonB [Bacteroidota bacterium]MBT7466346.1 energy transducer TonB [Bacteroidota bacterium]